MLVLILFVLAWIQALSASAQITWRVRSPVPGPAAGLPVSFGLALPIGQASRVEDLHVVNHRNEPVPVAWRVLAHWPDRSLRWVGGKLAVTLRRKPSGTLTLLRRRSERTPRAPASRAWIQVNEDDKAIEILGRLDARAASSDWRAVFPRNRGPILSQLGLGERPLFACGHGLRLTWWDETGNSWSPELGTARVRSGSSVVATVKAEGAAAEEATVDWTVRFRAGSRVIALEAVIRGWPGDATAGGVTFQLAAPLREIAYRSRRTRRIRRQRARRLSACLDPDATARWEVDGRAWTREEPPDLPVALGSGRSWLMVAPVDGRRRGGMTLAVSDRGRVEIVFRRGVGDGAREGRCRFQLVLAGNEGPPRVALWNAVVAAAQHGGGLVVPDARAFTHGGLGRIPTAAPGADRADAVFEQTLDLFLRELDRVENRTFQDHGDYRVPGLGWANGEYDVILALTRAHWWTRNPEVQGWIRRAVRHHLDVDLDWRQTGLPRMHGPGHDGGVDPGHTWLRGLLAYGLTSGDAEVVDAARGVAQGLVSYLKGTRGGLRMERDYGWTLRALTTAAEIWPEHDIVTCRDRVAEGLRRSIHERGLALVESTRKPRVARTTTFTGLGLLAPALAEYGRTCDRPRWCDLARRMARRYVVEAWDPETEQMAWSLLVDAVTGQVLRRRGTVTGGDLIFLAAGLAAVSDGPDGGWWQRQAEQLLDRGLVRFRRDGLGAHNGDRVRVLHALYELATGR